jgi:GTPase Era involved in 16S rRNA processing
MYFRDSDALVLCCTLQQWALDEMEKTMDAYLRAKEDEPGTFSVVISVNKSDVHSTEISMAQVREVANKYKIKHVIETSALNGINVNKVFETVATMALNVISADPCLVDKLERGESILPVTKKCNIM